MRNRKWLVHTCRLLIGLVIASNLLAAITFMLHPKLYMGGFELSGVPGKAAVAGFGILFLMWQVPYFFALADPLEYTISLISAVIMQAIGVVGESVLKSTIPNQHVVLRSGINRFIVFDAAGLALLVAAWLIVYRVRLTELGVRHV